MPEHGIEWQPRDAVLTLEEIERLVRVFTDLGIDKVRLTGGEPTVRKGLATLIERLSSNQDIKTLAMTTNGTTLAEHAPAYREAGLQQVNVSIDSLRPDRFFEITRRDCLDKVLAGLEAALEAGFDQVKVNVVVMEGVNSDELVDFVALAETKKVAVRFIEFMPFLGNRWTKAGLVPYRRMRETIGQVYDLEPLPGRPSDVAKEFSVQGFAGTVGFVTSMTDSFCGGCDRLRVTATGALRTCLFSTTEVSLRDPMRDGATDADLAKIVRETLKTKWAGHPDLTHLVQIGNKEMVSIGG